MSSPAPQATQLHAGDVVAERYLVERLLGRGGMGEVYEALDTKLERRVALKIVVAKASPDARRRLEAEAKAVAALEHPGIVTLHDVLEHGDLVVLVLELVPGTSLRDMIEREPLEPDTVGRIVTGVAQALEAAHARGFLHRDVKPDNVIVRPDGRTVLLDFGIAKGPAGLSPFAMTVTADGALMGTPGYLAPEQIRGEPVTAAVDQFALAVMAYELCTGRLPWNASSVASIIASIVSDSPKRFHDPPSDDDAEIESVFARALDKQPEERYPSVSAFAAALRTALGTTEKDALPRRPITPTEGGVPHAKKDLRTFTGPDASSTDASADASSTDASADAASADASSADELSPEAASLDEHSPDVHSPGGSASKSDVEVLERPIAPRKRVWMGGIALIAIGAVALTTIGTMRRETTPPSLAVSPSSAPSADASSELPDELPASGAPSDADRSAYREAVRALRRGELETATRALDTVIARSPAFAGAQLMRAYASFIRAVDLDERARSAFRGASAARSELSERDARLLDALAPSFLDPPRWRETAELLEAFLRDRPRDVLGWEALGFARVKLGDYEASERAFSKEIEIDPRAGLAYDLEAQFATARFDEEGAKSLLDTCVREVPGAMRCRIDISLLLAASGNCAEADQQARDALAIDPDSPRALAARARATAGLGATNDLVSGFLQRRRKPVPAEMRRALEIEDEFLLSKRIGDFSAALVALDPVTLGGSELSSTDATRLTLARVETLWEIGETREAAKVASTYLRLETTRPLPERGATDATGRMLSFLLAAGKITLKEQASRRDAWIVAWRARHTESEWKTEVGPIIWSSAFGAAGLPTTEQSRVALDAAKELGIDISPHISVNADPMARNDYAAVGELLMNVDRLDEAEKLLRRATRACAIAPDQIARLALGDLLARRGNTDEACATYAKIENDWGHAKPRSITLDASRTAAKKIHCPVL